MNTQTAASVLDQFEAQLEHFSAALTRNDSGDISLATAGLKTLVLGLAQFTRQSMQWRTEPELAIRLSQISLTLAANREHLMRRSVLTERALTTLIPSTRSDTYSVGLPVRRSYAGFGRQSGEFKVTTA